MTSEQEARIIALCERVGMPLERVPHRDDWTHAWDGRALNLAHRTAHGTSDFVHEVAHWLVATPERREFPDFGLDGMAVFRDPGDVEFPNPGDSIDEEVQASLLGILLERALGLDWRYTWEFHSWDCEGWRGVRAAIRDLRQRGLLSGLVPVCLLPAPAPL